MQEISTKFDNTLGPDGEVNATEVNNLATEVENAIKIFFSMDGGDLSQLAKAIDIHTKSTFYKDISATPNALELVRGTTDTTLETFKDGMSFLFQPANVNTGNVTLKLNALAVVPAFYNGVNLPVDFLKTTDVYLAEYSLANNRFDIIPITNNSGGIVNGTSKRDTLTVLQDGDTVFTVVGGYDPTYIDVFYKGHKLVNGVDVDVSTGANIEIIDPDFITKAGDWIDYVAYGTFQLADHYNKVEADLLHKTIPVRVKAGENLSKASLVKTTTYDSVTNLNTVLLTTSASDMVEGITIGSALLDDTLTVIRKGIVDYIDTTSFALNDILYASVGAVTNVKPTSGIFQIIGYVSKVHATQGEIYVDIELPQEVDYTKAIMDQHVGSIPRSADLKGTYSLTNTVNKLVHTSIGYDGQVTKLNQDMTQPNLISNGTFDVDTTGWSSYSGGILSVVNGKLKIVDASPFNSGAQQNIVTEIGVPYTIEFETFGTREAHALVDGISLGGQDATLVGLYKGKVKKTFIPTTTSTPIVIYTGAGTDALDLLVDNVSVRKSVANISDPLNAGAYFYDGVKTIINTGIEHDDINYRDEVFTDTDVGKLRYERASGILMEKDGTVNDLGAELVTNGTFDANVANWSVVNGTLIWEAGRAKMTQTVAVVSMTQVMPTVPGVMYRLTWDDTSSANTVIGYAEDIQGTIVYRYETVGINFLFFRAREVSTTIRFASPASDNAVYYLDNISCKEMLGWTEVPDGVVKHHNSTKTVIKSRSVIGGHIMFDTLRGTSYLLIDTDGAETYNTTIFKGYTTNGIKLGVYPATNTSGDNYYLHQTAYDRVVVGTTNHGKRYINVFDSKTNRFNMLYRGSAIIDHKLPHHLGVTPKFVINKFTKLLSSWSVVLDSNEYFTLDINAAILSTTIQNFDEEFINFTVTTGTNDTNLHMMSGEADSSQIKIGRFKGTGLDKNKVTLGFKPEWLLVYSTKDTTGCFILDNKRGDGYVYTATNVPENNLGVTDLWDIVDDGFYVNGTGFINTNNAEMFYIAYADTNKDGGGSYEDITGDTSHLSLTDGLLMFANGYDELGASNSTESFISDTPTTGLTLSPGNNYIKRSKGGNWINTKDKPVYGLGNMRTKANEKPDVYVESKWYNCINGDELIGNGTFDADIAGWSIVSGTGILVHDATTNSLKITESVGGVAYAAEGPYTLTIGKVYKLSYEITYVSSTYGIVMVGYSLDSPDIFYNNLAVLGKHEIEFTATESTLYVQLGAANGRVVNYDNVTLFEKYVEPNIAYPTPITYLSKIVEADNNGKVVAYDDAKLPDLYTDNLRVREISHNMPYVRGVLTSGHITASNIILNFTITDDTHNGYSNGFYEIPEDGEYAIRPDIMTYHGSTTPGIVGVNVYHNGNRVNQLYAYSSSYSTHDHLNGGSRIKAKKGDLVMLESANATATNLIYGTGTLDTAYSSFEIEKVKGL